MAFELTTAGDTVSKCQTRLSALSSTGNASSVAVSVPQQKTRASRKRTKDADTFEKSTTKNVLSNVAKKIVHVASTKTCSIVSKLTQTNPVTFLATLVGVELEEAGNALKNGAVKNEGGDFSVGYAKYFKKMKKNVKESKLNVVSEALNFIPNTISIGLTNGLKYAGCGAAKVVGKEAVSLIGSSLSAVGKVVNTAGAVIGTTVNAVFATAKNVVTGNKDGLRKTADETGKKFKEIFASAKDKAVEVGHDFKEFVVSGFKKVTNLIVGEEEA